jgi:RNase P subunit RPR2
MNNSNLYDSSKRSLLNNKSKPVTILLQLSCEMQKQNDQHDDLDKQLQFLYKATVFYSTVSPILSNHFSSKLVQVGIKNNIFFSSKSNLCVKCNTFLIPGLNCSVEIVKKLSFQNRKKPENQASKSDDKKDSEKSFYVRGLEVAQTEILKLKDRAARKRKHANLVVQHCYACKHRIIYHGNLVEDNPTKMAVEAKSIATPTSSKPNLDKNVPKSTSLKSVSKKSGKKKTQLAEMMKMHSRQSQPSTNLYSLDDFLHQDESKN